MDANKYAKEHSNTIGDAIFSAVNSHTDLKPRSFLKDTPRENTPWNKTQALAESMNMETWVIDTFMEL